ncbi:MAG: phage tail tape measure protein [Caldisericum sp.]
MTLEELVVKIGVETKEAEEKLAAFGEKIHNTGESFSKASTAFLVGGGAIIGALGMTVKAAAESESATARLGAALRATGQYSEENMKKMQELSTHLQNLAGVSDEAVTQAQAFGLQLGLTTEQVMKLMPKVLDLSAATGVDLETAMRATAMALQGHTGMLQRYGVHVEDTQKKVDELSNLLKKQQEEYDKLTLVISKGGPKAEEAKQKQQELAQAIEKTKEELVKMQDPQYQLNNLLDAFSGYSGSAEAKGKTLAGQLAILRETAGDLAEKVGFVLVPILKDLIEKHIQPLINRLSELDPKVVENGVKFVALAGIIMTVIGTISKLVNIFSSLGALFTPQGLILMGIGAFVLLIVKIVEHWEDIKKAFTGFYERYVKPWLDPLIAGLKIVVGFFEKIVNFFKSVGSKIAGAIKSSAEGVGEALGNYAGNFATGGVFEVSRPTLFLAGEAGKETVSIIPEGQASGINVTYNIYGANDSETLRRVLREHDRELLNALRGGRW